MTSQRAAQPPPQSPLDWRVHDAWHRWHAADTPEDRERWRLRYEQLKAERDLQAGAP